jgi:hypothetical protein
VWLAPGPETVGKAEEIDLVDAVQDLHEGTLDQLVLERGHPEWPLASVRLGYEYAPDRLRSVRSSSQAFGEVLEVAFQLLPIALPRFAVHSWCRFPLEAEVGLAQGPDVVDVVQERGESSPLVRPLCLPYAVPRTGHALPVLRPGRVLRARIPLGPPPSLHPLRERCVTFARPFRRALAVSGVSTFVPA